MENHKKITWKYIKGKLMTFHLPIILILAIGIGVLFPQPGIILDVVLIYVVGQFMAKTIFSKVCVFCIFIISGLKLDISSVKSALQFWPVIVFS